MRISENTLHGLKSHLVSTHIISSVYRNKRTGKTGAHESAHDNFNWMILDEFIHNNHECRLESIGTSL